jgi:lysylphosphatidylglycerol synthetase-like protein (DUF2156 family)
MQPAGRGRDTMNLEKVVFGFFVILSCTLNFGFFIGDIDRPELHHPGELFAAVVVNLIALVLKFGDRTHIGATHLATSLAACLQLLAASLVWTWDAWVLKEVMDGGTMATIVSLSAGALVANLISVVLLIGETLRSSR